ncbi:MAG: ATP-binding protein [Bacteroides sp.]|nr:ATP-binding protein [Bacteroides sp.]
MGQELIGRATELAALKRCFDSDRSEFIAVYGRRRVGKTFLIRKAAEDKFTFFITGVYQATKSEQLTNFAIALQKCSQAERLSIPRNWILAFYDLARYIEQLPQGRKLIFIDELPWMDTAKSGFIAALENFWNSWAVLRNDIKLIVCGSATSWMISNLIRNKGGLHNRLTYHLVLNPFTLGECEEFFKTLGFAYTRKQIAECYMAMGGIPYYMSMLDRSKSLAQNIDRLFFEDNAPLREEFNDLYRALFKNASPHIAVVTALATKGKGMTRQELLDTTKLTNNGAFSTVLEELEHCGFIRLYQPFGSARLNDDKRLRNDTLFQLQDFYTLFYFHFVRGNRYGDEHFWSASLNSPLHHTWIGLSFEMLCLSHLKQIKQALGISGVQTLACSWRSTKSTTEKGAQIDLLIDRKDDTINVCEMKYSKDTFEIDKEYEEKLQNKLNAFVRETATKKSLLLTMITTYGVKPNAHSGIVQSEIVLDDLFRC